MKKNEVAQGHILVNNKKLLTIEEKVVHIKNHLHLTCNPIGDPYDGQYIDELMRLVNDDWKGDGADCYI